MEPVSRTNRTVLVVDDEAHMRRFLKATLTQHGYDTREAVTGAKALAEVRAGRANLVLLDLGLPDIDGTEITSQIRAESRVPIIIISARGREHDKVEALDRGANDYLTKPFGAAELLARIRAALRNVDFAPQEPQASLFRVGELSVDLKRHEVFLADREVHLTPTEYNLLVVMIRYADCVVSHELLLREVWGPGYDEQTQYLRVYMRQLRYKLESEPAQPKYLVTVLGVGYRLRREVDEPVD